MEVNPATTWYHLREFYEGAGTMGKSVIVYASLHHQNTYQLVAAIAGRHNVDLINAAEIPQAD